MLFSGGFKKFGKLNSRSENITSILMPQRKGRVFCSEFRQFSNVVLPDVNVAVCCSDFSLKHIIGNLLVDRLADIHRSERTRSFVDEMLSENWSFCNSCEYAAPISDGFWGKFLSVVKVVYSRIRQ
jgi:radical SAM protein with 4Fe4S-binding SPASM domain